MDHEREKEKEMAIQLEEKFLDDLFPDDLSDFCRDELLLPDDIWSKFELDLPGFNDPDDFFQEFDSFSGSSNSTFNILDLDDDKEIRNHDCMWAGHCGSKEHSADEPRHTIVPAAPVPIIKAPAATAAAVPTSSTIVNNAVAPAALPATIIAKPTAAKAQQSLLKNNLRATQVASTVMLNSHTPQTPPMSDDEDCKAKISKLPLIYHTQHHDGQSHIDDDSDLREYFKGEMNEDISIKEEVLDDDEDEEEEEQEEEEVEEEEEEEQEQKPDIRSFQFAATIDHSYFKDKNAPMHMNNLGIDTPSDSEEEEIDVVSVGEKYTTINRMALPTNPSTRDRQQLQRRMATAISNKRKTMQKVPPTVSSTMMTTRKQYLDTPAPSPMKRRMAEPRNVKRTKQYHHRMTAAASSSTSSPYKRRTNYGNSSDSEPEPSEKRSLHNNMERQRRIDLRNAFEDLRKLVPEVFKKDKAPKVVILREAAKYCNHLGNVAYNHNRQMEELKKRQEWLRQRVSQLRRSLAAKR